jgi:hypothetical protein
MTTDVDREEFARIMAEINRAERAGSKRWKGRRPPVLSTGIGPRVASWRGCVNDSRS